MGDFDLSNMLDEEIQQAKRRLNITDDKLFDELCELICLHYNSFTEHELDILCRVICGESRKVY